MAKPRALVCASMTVISSGVYGLVFSTIVIYVLGICIVVFAPEALLSEIQTASPNGNTTVTVEDYSKDGRYESVVVANSSIVTIILVMITARVLSWTGDHLVTLTRKVSKDSKDQTKPSQTLVEKRRLLI